MLRYDELPVGTTLFIAAFFLVSFDLLSLRHIAAFLDMNSAKSCLGGVLLSM